MVDGRSLQDWPVGQVTSLGHSATIPSAVEMLSSISEKILAAEAAVTRKEARLAQAMAVLDDLRVAQRVCCEIFGLAAPTTEVREPSAVSIRQKAILELLGIGPGEAKTPAMLFDAYWDLRLEQTTIETFRTTIWRMKQRRRFGDWIIHSADGSYWKSVAVATPCAPTSSDQPPESSS